MRMKASARPCTPIPIGLWRIFDLLACGETNRLLTCTGPGYTVDEEATLEKKANLGNRVVVDVNNLVQVLDNDFGDRGELFEVIGLFWGDIHVESDGCKVTHCNLSGKENKPSLKQALKPDVVIRMS